MTAATRAAFGAVATTTASVLPVFLTGALTVQISAELGFDPAGLGLLVALYFAVSAVVSLPAGWLVERFGAGLAIRTAVVGVTVVMGCIAAFATSFTTLAVFMLCGAWCNVIGQLGANLALAGQVPERRLGLSFGMKQAAIPTATLLSGIAVPAIALTVGWRWAYVIGAGLALSTLLAAPRDTGRHRTSATPQDRATGALSVVGAAAGLGSAAATALGIFLVSSAAENGIEPGLAGLTLTMGSIVGLGVRLLNGWLADRRDGGHVAVVAGSLLLGAGGLAMLSSPNAVALVIGTVLAFGLGWSWPGLLQFAVVRLNPSAPAAATSIVQAGVYAGGFIGPVGFGFLATHFSFRVAWLVGAAIMLLAAVMMLVARRMLVAHTNRARAARDTRVPAGGVEEAG